ncbi:hypothetical protein G3I32_25590 [Streptomyces coelicoflavus]|uniref:Uncharacterized protein n=1 Tax=Streptomyces coelicoflavus TaxID=285562 RepID=A0A7K3PQD1_9ACTN|nr:hypothetical protein [Streptomyces coelicoflavus]
MLHPRTSPARARTDGPARVPLLPVPVFAPGASTGRTPTTLTTALRHTAKDFRRSLTRKVPAAPTAPASSSAPHETPAWRLWAGLARGYLALALSLLPRPRPARTFTVFVASADPLGARRGGPAPY